MTYTTRYSAFLVAKGSLPLYEFIIWISQQWGEWRGITGRVPPATPEDHDAFDAWLADKFNLRDPLVKDAA